MTFDHLFRQRPITSSSLQHRSSNLSIFGRFQRRSLRIHLTRFRHRTLVRHVTGRRTIGGPKVGPQRARHPTAPRNDSTLARHLTTTTLGFRHHRRDFNNTTLNFGARHVCRTISTTRTFNLTGGHIHQIVIFVRISQSRPMNFLHVHRTVKIIVSRRGLLNTRRPYAHNARRSREPNAMGHRTKTTTSANINRHLVNHQRSVQRGRGLLIQWHPQRFRQPNVNFQRARMFDLTTKSPTMRVTRAGRHNTKQGQLFVSSHTTPNINNFAHNRRIRFTRRAATANGRRQSRRTITELRNNCHKAYFLSSTRRLITRSVTIFRHKSFPTVRIRIQSTSHHHHSPRGSIVTISSCQIKGDIGFSIIHAIMNRYSRSILLPSLLVSK